MDNDNDNDNLTLIELFQAIQLKKINIQKKRGMERERQEHMKKKTERQYEGRGRS